MLDLKPYLDAVTTADAEVQTIAHKIDDLFREESDESKLAALELRPALDEAQNKHAQAVSLYEAMQKANRPNDTARNFVPVTTEVGADEDQQPTVIKRDAYEKMSPIDRGKFIRSGGTVED